MTRSQPASAIDQERLALSDLFDWPAAAQDPAQPIRPDLDDLEVIELRMALEDRLGIEISDEDADLARTVGDWARMVEAKTDALPAPANPAPAAAPA